MQIKASSLFKKNLDAYNQGYRFIVNQGGARSSKTYSILMLLNYLALNSQDTYSVVSCTFPHLQKGAYRDWKKIMYDWDIYDEQNHNKTYHTYTWPDNNYTEFFSVDQPEKVRGPSRDVLFINEANLISKETFTQLNIRTRKTVFMDYNPADEFHWIYDDILTRDDCFFIKSTYKDNPFLPPEQVKEIEMLQKTDKNKWRVYGLGERGVSEATVYTHYQYGTTDKGNVIYGLDFGYNNPTALVEVRIYDNAYYVKELLYRTHVTNNELIDFLKQNGIRGRIYADAAEPNRIAEIKRASIDIMPADKDVNKGIDKVKSSILFLDKKSFNLVKEAKNYKFLTNLDGQVLEKPDKSNDHLMDAMRYAIYTHTKRSGTYFGKTVISQTNKGALGFK